MSRRRCDVNGILLLGRFLVDRFAGGFETKNAVYQNGFFSDGILTVIKCSKIHFERLEDLTGYLKRSSADIAFSAFKLLVALNRHFSAIRHLLLC